MCNLHNNNNLTKNPLLTEVHDLINTMKDRHCFDTYGEEFHVISCFFRVENGRKRIPLQ